MVSVVTIHHTVTPGTWTAEQIAREHIGGKEPWPGIGYHFLVTPAGEVLYVGDVATIRFHDTVNDDSVGVSMIGNFQAVLPPEAQLRGAAMAILASERVCGRVLAIIPHRARTATSCPGDTWRGWWQKLIGMVQSWREAGSMVSFDGRTFASLQQSDPIAYQTFVNAYGQKAAQMWTYENNLNFLKKMDEALDTLKGMVSSLREAVEKEKP
jgi:hypothetical protein